MTDDVNVSYSFQLGGNALSNSPAPQAQADLQTFAYTDCEQVSINDSTVMIINRRNRKKMVVTRDVGNALTHCNHFETLSNHTAKLCATNPLLREQQADVLQVLKSARDAGVLTDSAQITQRLNRAVPASTCTPTRVFIITCDRPVAIARLLDSMLAGCDLSRHEQLFLIDDSRHASNAQQNQTLVAQFNLKSAQPMLYFGAAAAATLLAQLVQELPAQERGLRFLLDRKRWAAQPTYGLSRNLCLLLSVGYRALVLDDDILCRVVQPPATAAMNKPGPAFDHQEAREAWFYPTEAALLEQSVWCEFDPLSRHADAVGKSLCEVLATLNGGPLDSSSLDHCNGNMLNVLHGESRILVTQCGSAGDPGTAGVRWVVNLGKDSIARLLASGSDPQVLPNSQMCWLGHTRPTISLRGVMSQMTGLDNSQLLPPFAPILRGEDDLFATMTTYLHPDCAVLNYDWAVLHLPVDDRSAAKTLRPFTGSVGLSTLAGYLRGKIDVHNHASVECRLASLAGEIRALGEYPGAAFLAGCDVELTRNRAVVINTLRICLAEDRRTSHPGWQNFVNGFLREAQAALTAPGAPEKDALPDWVRSTQEAALEFAQALQSWSAIRTHSSAITAKLIASQTLLASSRRV